jgi:predicted nucleic acid-binding protein
MTPKPNNSVMSWFAVQSERALFTTSVTQAEMCLGVAILPVGQRQSSLLVAIDDMFNQDFAGRILAFDSSVVRAYVQIVTQRKQIGRPISQFDAQIAAIAKAHDAILATRNIKDFENCGIELVNPWL